MIRPQNSLNRRAQAGQSEKVAKRLRVELLIGIDRLQALSLRAIFTAGDLTRLEQASVVMTLGNLMTFPWISRRVQAGELELLGTYFDVATGGLSAYDRASGGFATVVDDRAAQ